MIHERIKAVMKARDVSQSDLMAILGADLQRVKNLTGGRVKLRKEEAARLVECFGVREQYLATGEGEMFISQEELTLNHRLEVLQRITNKLAAMNLPASLKPSLQMLIMGFETEEIPVLLSGAEQLADVLQQQKAAKTS